MSAIIAALYTVLTLFSAVFGLSGGAVQLRLSEALCVLPMFTHCGIYGLFVGCMLSNFLFGGAVFDIVFGSLATLIGAVGTFLIGKKHPLLAILPPVLANTAIMPFVISYSYGAEASLWVMFFSIFISECVSCGALGIIVYRTANRIKFVFSDKK